jgi:SAM-dependent methyltransferase
MKKKTALKAAEPIRIDIGCGKNKRPGFVGVDQFAMDGVDVVMDLRTAWPWADGSVEEAHCSHFVEHLTGAERVTFFNELHRVLKPGAKATIVTPHWASGRAYGDFTHQWPPVSEMFFFYLSAAWRETQAPHTDAKWNAAGYRCDFDAVWGYGMNPAIMTRNEEYRNFALANYKEAALDTHATLTKK